MKSDFEARKFLREKAESARRLREQSRRFLGFEGSLSSIQAKMLEDFNASAVLEHSGDKGTAREEVLRRFLQSPYLPKRYEVAEAPSKVVATNGATSEQIDIAIFDALDSPRLLDVGGIQYFPVESVLGVIQVKSNIAGAKDIVEGLDNIASFKRLRCLGADAPLGFGVLFAYTASLKWSSIFSTITEWERSNPNTCWPNLICVLDQGCIVNLVNRRSTVHNLELHNIAEANIFPILNDGAELVSFYLLLLDMLASTRLPRIPHWSYANLPMWVDGHSVRFTFGSHVQVENCHHHGSYLKDLRVGAAKEIVEACVGQKMINQFSLFGSAVGEVGPPDSYLFNPEGHEPEVVVRHIGVLHGAGRPAIVTEGGIDIEAIEIDGKVYLIPRYYDFKYALVRRCQKCPEPAPISDMTLDQWQLAQRERAEEILEQANEQSDEGDPGNTA